MDWGMRERLTVMARKCRRRRDCSIRAWFEGTAVPVMRLRLQAIDIDVGESGDLAHASVIGETKLANHTSLISWNATRNVEINNSSVLRGPANGLLHPASASTTEISK